MDPSLMYQAVANGQVDLIGAFSTDGRIAALDLVLLEDERHAIPPYDALILAGARLVREHPDAIAALRALNGAIDADRMRRMNSRRGSRTGKSPRGGGRRSFVEGQRSKVKRSKVNLQLTLIIMSDPVLDIRPLGHRWQTVDPFLFCVHHIDYYPKGNERFGPAVPLTGHEIGQDFEGVDGWRMYHGDVVPASRSTRIAASRR